MWDCEKCGTLGIMGLPNCPTCGASRPEGAVSATVLPAQDVSATPDAGPSDSLAGEEKKDVAAIDSGSQAPKSKTKS